MEGDYYLSGEGLPSPKENLKDRIREVRTDLRALKQKLYMERTLLNKRKQEILSENEITNGPFFYKEPLPSDSAVVLNKTHLKDIQRKCDMELKKLDNYIANIKHLKDNWAKAREDWRQITKKMKKREEVPMRKQYSRGKVFYVDSCMY